MPKKNAGPKEQWTETHDRALLQALITHTLTARPVLYATPGLEHVREHGGERINKKIQARLKLLCADHPDILEAAVKGKVGRKRGREGEAGEDGGGGDGKGKGKRVKKEVKEAKTEA